MVSNLSIVNQMYDEMTDALISVFNEDFYVKKAIMRSFKNNKHWDDSVKRTFSDMIYDIVRYWRFLWHILDMDPSLKKEDVRLLIDMYVFYKAGRTSERFEINGIDDRQFEKTLRDAQNVRVLRESIPDWLDDLGVKEFAERWDALIKALNRKPPIVIRTNTLKITTDELIRTLRNESIHIKRIEQMADALIITDRINIFDLKSFKEGLFEMQNDASQMVSIFLGAEPGMRVIDVCAGEGGKTLHLAALMQNKGKIIALDTKEWKLKELHRRAVKASAENIEIRLINSSKAYKRLKETADRVLLDVPCSGLGTLRRNPDIKWKLTPATLQRLIELQQDLLVTHFPLVRKGGKMVYSVCSILSSEGEQQVRTFLQRHGNIFHLIEEKRYWPDTDDTDGFYMALLQRI